MKRERPKSPSLTHSGDATRTFLTAMSLQCRTKKKWTPFRIQMSSKCQMKGWLVISKVLPVHHVETLQVSQGFADLEAVQEQCGRSQDVLLLPQVAPQLSGEVGGAKPGLASASGRILVRRVFISQLQQQALFRQSHSPLRACRAPWLSTRGRPR